MTIVLASCGPRDAAGTQGGAVDGQGRGGQAQQGGTPGGRGGGGGGGAARGGRGMGMAYPPGTPAPVEISIAALTPIARSTTVTGTLEPIRTVGVTSILAGTLLSVRAEEGTRVRAGTVLAELDTRELSAQLRSSEAALALARGNFERSKALLAEKVITAAEFERDRTAFAAAESNTEQLRTRIGFANITAPISGVVATKTVEAGDVISGQRQLFTIADVSTLVTRLAVSELNVVALRVGATVPITIDALPGEPIEGRIRRIFPAADAATRLVPVEVAISGDAVPGLKPGFSVRAKLALDEAREGITVPSRALQGGASSRYLFVVNGNKALRRGVRAGDDIEGLTEIYSGVEEGDTVVVAGSALLRDGATVRIVRPLQAEPGGGAPSPVGRQ
jgi:RND family efflux transporter MFP subunit